MLEEILRLLSAGQSLNAVQLARHLGVTHGLVDQMLDDLERGGYIARFDLGCATDHCEHCASKGGCSTQPTFSGWSLTDKGRRLATAAPEPDGHAS